MPNKCCLVVPLRLRSSLFLELYLGQWGEYAAECRFEIPRSLKHDFACAQKANHSRPWTLTKKATEMSQQIKKVKQQADLICWFHQKRLWRTITRGTEHCLHRSNFSKSLSVRAAEVEKYNGDAGPEAESGNSSLWPSTSVWPKCCYPSFDQRLLRQDLIHSIREPQAIGTSSILLEHTRQQGYRTSMPYAHMLYDKTPENDSF